MQERLLKMQRYSLIIQIQVLRNANLGTNKETLPKKLDRMSAAHLAVELIDSEVQECQAKFKASKKQSQRKLFTDDYKRKKVLLDGAYTELKRAQEATVKSIHVQRQKINSYLESSKEDSDQVFTYYPSIIFRIKRKAKKSSILLE